jgi:hypothetical protein
VLPDVQDNQLGPCSAASVAAQVSAFRLPGDSSTPTTTVFQVLNMVSSRVLGCRGSGAGGTVPDETWSVVQLRAEARDRGVTGMANKTKAQLLAALS